MWRFHSKYWVLCIIGLLVLITGCDSAAVMAEKKAEMDKVRTLYLVDTSARDFVDINYRAGNSDVDLRLFFNKEFELHLDNKGAFAKPPTVTVQGQNNPKPGDPKSPPPAKDLEKDLQRVLALYEDAQAQYYAKNYDGSLDAIDASIAILPTTEAYALKGSVLFMLGNIEEAQKNWKKAKELDPDFVMPTIINK